MVGKLGREDCKHQSEYKTCTLGKRTGCAKHLMELRSKRKVVKNQAQARLRWTPLLAWWCSQARRCSSVRSTWCSRRRQSGCSCSGRWWWTSPWSAAPPVALMPPEGRPEYGWMPQQSDGTLHPIHHLHPVSALYHAGPNHATGVHGIQFIEYNK